MKKSKILVPAVALLALGMAASTTATVAWFVSSGATTINAYNADTEGLSTIGSSIDLGTFKVTAVAETSLEAVQLTNTSGESYVFTSGTAGSAGSGKVQVPVTDGVRTVDCKLLVTYVSKSGEPAKTGAEIKAIWGETIGSKAIGIKATSDGDVRFLASASPADAAAWAGTVGTTGVTNSVSNSALLALSFNNCAGNGAEADATSNADAASDWFVAITGDDVNVEVAESHTLTFTPQTAA